MNTEKIISALDSVTWYNGLAEYVFKWFMLSVSGNAPHVRILNQDNYCAGNDYEAVEQLQILWMMGVLMYGNYGTSPRYGWIENIDGFRRWCLAITKTWRSSDDYSGPEKYKGCGQEE